ncbi:hypothetical protein RYX36_021750, partial [Vicia faba]
TSLLFSSLSAIYLHLHLFLCSHQTPLFPVLFNSLSHSFNLIYNFHLPLHLRSAMTAEEVSNVHIKENSDNGAEDRHKIVTEHCNGDVRGKEISENGNDGGEVISGSVDSDPIVTVDGNGVALEDHKVEGESHINAITEEPCVVSNGSVDETTIVDVVEREGEIRHNGTGSDVNNVHVTDTVAEVGNDSEIGSVQNGAVEEEEKLKVEDRELESV